MTGTSSTNSNRQCQQPRRRAGQEQRAQGGCRSSEQACSQASMPQPHPAPNPPSQQQPPPRAEPHHAGRRHTPPAYLAQVHCPASPPHQHQATDHRHTAPRPGLPPFHSAPTQDPPGPHDRAGPSSASQTMQGHPWHRLQPTHHTGPPAAPPILDVAPWGVAKKISFQNADR